jgi:hypothetical protein
MILRCTQSLCVYLSASTVRAAEIGGYAEDLRADGHVVASTWHQTIGRDPLSTAATRDYQELSGADVLVAFTQGLDAAHQGRGGRHVELGIAVARSMSLLLVGPKEHVFHHLPQVATFATWEPARLYLSRLALHGPASAGITVQRRER